MSVHTFPAGAVRRRVSRERPGLSAAIIVLAAIIGWITILLALAAVVTGPFG